MTNFITLNAASDGFHPGERPIENAPQIELKNGRRCIPQHFLTYQHNRASVEEILSHIEYDDRYLLFVSEDGTVPYIQVGIVGFDNYKAKSQQSGQKIVFGRRWRVEPNLPTSEIIQTSFLAIKKAREHEIRELFKLTCKGFSATPFNSHHDLPLLTRNKDLLEGSEIHFSTVEACIESVRFDGTPFKLINIEQRRDDQWLVDISHDKYIMTLILPSLDENTLLYALMDDLIATSDRHVDEAFTYKGFHRFSRKNNVAALAELSANVRAKFSEQNCANTHFDQNLAQEKYDTDSSRVPQLTHSHYSDILRQRLAALDITAGFMPN